jgi:hypothetical protein
MIVFKWDKWDTHSTLCLKEFVWEAELKFWKWKSTILCHTVYDFEIKDIIINNERYVIFTNAGIYEADEIETLYYGNGIMVDSNSTWSRNG